MVVGSLQRLLESRDSYIVAGKGTVVAPSRLMAEGPPLELDNVLSVEQDRVEMIEQHRWRLCAAADALDADVQGLFQLLGTGV